MSTTPRSPLRKLLTFVAAVFFVVLAAIALLGMLTSWRGNEVERRLRTHFAGRSLGESFPPRSANETTRALDAITASLGLGTSDFKTPRDDKKSPFRAERRAAVRDLLDPNQAQLEGSLAALGAPPAAVSELLAEIRPTLDRATTLLNSSPAPIWPRDLSRGAEVVLPNYLPILDLQKLLIVDAREQARAGENAVAFARLDASWKLNQAVLDDPYLISQIIAEPVARMQVGLLRLLAAPPAWSRRLATLRLRENALTALRAEAYLALATARSKWVGGLFRPHFFARWVLTDHASRFEKSIAEFERADIRTFDPQAFDRAAKRGLPRWQFFTRQTTLPETWQHGVNSAEIELAAELAALGIDERARFANGGPPRGFERKPSRVAGIDWIFREVTQGDRPGTWIEASAEMKSRSEKALPTRLFVPREARVP